MIVDSSAIVAIHEGEPERDAFTSVLRRAAQPRMASPTYVECALVLDNKRPESSPATLDDLLDSLGIEIIPFTPEHAREARRAHRRYGRGSGHPARLNLGDCFSYAVAILDDEPLLFKGEDFTHTDVTPALEA